MCRIREERRELERIQRWEMGVELEKRGGNWKGHRVIGGVCMGIVEQKRGWVLGTDRQGER